MDGLCKKGEDRFTMIKGGKGYTIADIEALPAPFSLYLKQDNRSYVEPDISVICDMGKKSEKGCLGAPN